MLLFSEIAAWRWSGSVLAVSLLWSSFVPSDAVDELRTAADERNHIPAIAVFIWCRSLRFQRTQE